MVRVVRLGRRVPGRRAGACVGISTRQVWSLQERGGGMGLRLGVTRSPLGRVCGLVRGKGLEWMGTLIPLDEA